MKIKMIFFTGMLSFFASTAVLAEPKEWKDADANGDGSIDQAEFSKTNVEDMSYADVDTDKNGKISKEEYEEALSGCE